MTVDFARGLLAIGVLFYHVLAYQGHTPLVQIGRFGVYAFFVISGFALYLNYRNLVFSGVALQTYFIARFSRIAPLYYLATGLSLVAYGLSDFSFRKLFLNLTFIFGVANPGEASMVTGGWSIGIEMAFYAIFPVIIVLCGGNLRRLIALCLVSVFTQLVFVNDILTGVSFGDAWVEYTQPVAFFGYFASGCLLGEILLRRASRKGRPGAYIIVAICILPFLFVPLQDSTILTGWIGLLLCMATIFGITAVAFLPEPRGPFRLVAEWVGRMSYPVYLLHPVVYFYVAKLPEAGFHLPLTIAATFVLSEVVHRFIERPSIRFLRSRLGSSARGQHAAA
ncbi:acyltransferase family protein [Devosia sediminis]|uniref:Acyltransferase n=1 Tax=Devosia sediminis TaxID=2798801 RepID=A0A934IXM2_9HYPH|nr:acyltransferase [Devosia sediminis]MBJ3785051.1 acyltransferase [Devosia sediminis]